MKLFFLGNLPITRSKLKTLFKINNLPQPEGKGPYPAVVAPTWPTGANPFVEVAAVLVVASEVVLGIEVDEGLVKVEEPDGRSSGRVRLLWRRRSNSVIFCCSCNRWAEVAFIDGLVQVVVRVLWST